MAVTSVASAASDTQLLPPRNRRMATVRNTDANILYLLLDSGVSSSSNHTVALSSGQYYEVPAAYTGEIRGIWAADGSGAAIITEF